MHFWPFYPISLFIITILCANIFFEIYDNLLEPNFVIFEHVRLDFRSRITGLCYHPRLMNYLSWKGSCICLKLMLGLKVFVYHHCWISMNFILISVSKRFTSWFLVSLISFDLLCRSSFRYNFQMFELFSFFFSWIFVWVCLIQTWRCMQHRHDPNNKNPIETLPVNQISEIDILIYPNT